FKFDKSEIGTSLDTTDYISFTVTASAGFQLNLDGGSVTFDVASKQNGKEVDWTVRSSVLGFGTDIATGNSSSASFSGATASLSGTSYDGLSSIEVRIYGWSPGNVDLFVDNITLNGSVVPE